MIKLIQMCLVCPAVEKKKNGEMRKRHDKQGYRKGDAPGISYKPNTIERVYVGIYKHIQETRY
jgi:hypothetical protein